MSLVQLLEPKWYFIYITGIHTESGDDCNDPHQIIQVFNKFDQVDQPIVGGAKLTFSRMNNFGLTKTPFRRPRRYEFTDR